ncbi:MAG: TonB family protein [Flavobacteriales bacterium]|nr:TonB family protein [Flavobacteriales bacterium]
MPLRIQFLILWLVNAYPSHGQDNLLPYVEREPAYDIAPRFPGGSDAMMRYFADSVRYPDSERSRHKEGQVLAAFTITKNGRMSAVRIVNGVPGAPGLAAEARRLLEAMPKWEPARKRGRRVAAEVNLSVPFRIDRSDRKR